MYWVAGSIAASIYAAACNVDAIDMRKDLQFNPDARKQFADWKALKNAS